MQDKGGIALLVGLGDALRNPEWLRALANDLGDIFVDTENSAESCYLTNEGESMTN
jgi:hypothetical protein